VRYFVIGKDGGKFGPADVGLLRSWREQSRLTDDTWLEEEGTGHKLLAREVLGPAQAAAAPQEPSAPPTGQATQQPSPYPRQGSGRPPDNGNNFIIFGWILAVFSLGCCPPLTGGTAIVLGYQAKKRGHPGAQTLIIAAVIMMVVGIVVGVIVNLNNPFLQDLMRG